LRNVLLKHNNLHYTHAISVDCRIVGSLVLPSFSGRDRTYLEQWASITFA